MNSAITVFEPELFDINNYGPKFLSMRNIALIYAKERAKKDPPPDSEILTFVIRADESQLNPLANQIYLIRYGATWTHVVGVDGFRVIAERTGNYMPGRCPEYTYDDKGKVVTCKTFVKKKDDNGVWHECEFMIFASDYAKDQGCWKNMFKHMLYKCCLCANLKNSFPQQLSGFQSKEALELEGKTIDVEVKWQLTQEQLNELYELEQYAPKKLLDNIKSHIRSYDQMSKENYERIIPILRVKKEKSQSQTMEVPQEQLDFQKAMDGE
jgi:phage recombination protein Bet